MVSRVLLVFLLTLCSDSHSSALENANSLYMDPALAEPATVEIIYVYDELGRLIAVIDPTGDTAIYTYDAVGNLLSITRQSSSLVAVIEFTPESGPVGTSVKIYGTGFSSTPSQNTVTFNGVTASVSSSTQNQIITSVPAGATTGPIAVTSPSGSATSSASFTVVTGAGGPPSISSFTPAIATVGTAVTISGSNFETDLLNNNLSFHKTHAPLTSATSSSIDTSVPIGATSGKITVSTPSGTAVSSADFFVPPSPFLASDVVFTGRMSVGSSATATISPASKVGLMLFDGTIGQRISLNITGVTITNSNLYINNPDGTTLYAVTSIGSTGRFVEPLTLPGSGTYTMLIDPLSTYTGSMTLSLYNVVDVTGPIIAGGSPVTVSVTTPGQNARLTFTGSSGQSVSLNVTGVTIPNAKSYVSIIKPDGSDLVAPVVVNSGGRFIDAVTLGSSGTYTVLLDPVLANLGNATLRLYDVVDVAATITPGGSSVVVTTTVPGQNVRLTFSGISGQRVSLKTTNVTTGSGTFTSILNPDGSTLASFSGVAAYIDVQVLSVDGTYAVLLNPANANTGGATVTLYDVPADATGTLTIGGGSIGVTITTPGQNGALTFSGTSGQQATVRITNNTIGSITVTLLKPDGTQLTQSAASGSTFNLATQTLPVTGTYTIKLDPTGDRTGSINVSVTNP